jgi:iron-sulfur cluster assembly protein
MAVSLTESAARQIKKQLEKRGKGVGLKLGVRKSGCSGYAYSDAAEADDAVFEDFGVKVIVQKNDLPFIDGIQLDYRREGINEAFQFNNPNVTGSCGCGESFTVE